MHSYDHRPCSACGDLDGCHIPGKVKRCIYSSTKYGLSYPRIVALCGSTRFKDEYEKAMADFTLEGDIVLTVGLFGHKIGMDMNSPVKTVLDELHLRKIDLAEIVYVVNPGGYIGNSTRREIEYARKHRKVIAYLCPPENEESNDEPQGVSEAQGQDRGTSEESGQDARG